MVPEVADQQIREIIHGSYRIVYRVIHEEVHVLTIHHSARLLALD
jgi:plasmid stabilization system protein ParE